MFFLIKDSKDIMLVEASRETVQKFWTKFWTYRYDFNFTFYDFLRENGIYARKIPPWSTPPGSGTIDIDICPN